MKTKGLNIQQKAFSRYYILGTKEFRLGHATKSYAKAYELDLNNETDVDTSSSNGVKLLRNTRIKKYMQDLLEGAGWNDSAVDSRLSEIMHTGAHKDSINALKEFNKLKQRITDKVDLEILGVQIFVPAKKKEMEQ